MEGWLCWRSCFAACDGWRACNGAWCHSQKGARGPPGLPAGPGWSKAHSTQLLIKYRTSPLVSQSVAVHSSLALVGFLGVGNTHNGPL